MRIKLECPNCGTRVNVAGRCSECATDEIDEMWAADQRALEDAASREDY